MQIFVQVFHPILTQQFFDKSNLASFQFENHNLLSQANPDNFQAVGFAPPVPKTPILVLRPQCVTSLSDGRYQGIALWDGEIEG